MHVESRHEFGPHVWNKPFSNPQLLQVTYLYVHSRAEQSRAEQIRIRAEAEQSRSRAEGAHLASMFRALGRILNGVDNEVVFRHHKHNAKRHLDEANTGQPVEY